jgi:hypothetical protein
VATFKAAKAPPTSPVLESETTIKSRAFLWAATERVSGAQRLVAWLDVCRPREEGGLGIRSLHVQNRCLLTKLLHRLHSGLDRPGLAGSGGCSASDR